MKFMSDTSLSELVTKIKEGFLPIKEVHASTPDGTIDLDSFLTSGIYIIYGMGAAVSPHNATGYLIVLSFAYDQYTSLCEQIWVDRNLTTDTDKSPGVYLRSCNDGSWTVWKGLTNETDYEYVITSLEDKLDSSDFTLTNITGTLPINKGGTGATTASGALTNLGIATTEYTPTALNNCTVTGCKVYKTLDRVYLEGYISVLPTSTSPHQVRAANLPEACRPTVNSRGLAYIKSNDNVVSSIALEVTTTGNAIFTGIVGVQSGSSFSYQTVYFSTSYHVDN